MIAAIPWKTHQSSLSSRLLPLQILVSSRHLQPEQHSWLMHLDYQSQHSSCQVCSFETECLCLQSYNYKKGP